MELRDQADIITSRAELAEFVIRLRADLQKNPGDWSNTSLSDFLEALSAWIEDMDDYYLNNQLPVPEQPAWRTVAEMLLAAKVYE